jgi:hypothetical protein
VPLSLVLIFEAVAAVQALVLLLSLVDSAHLLAGPCWQTVLKHLLEVLLGVKLLWLLGATFAHVGSLHLGSHQAAGMVFGDFGQSPR